VAESIIHCEMGFL